jgi:hypothetical protein
MVDAEKREGSASSVRIPWIGDAIARLVRDDELQRAAASVATGFADASFSAAPWQAVAVAADGQPLAVAAESSGRVVVASAAPAAHIVTPLLIRSLANALGDVPDLQREEVAPIADRMLSEWARPSAIPSAPTGDSLRESEDRLDRRWLWLAALCLLAIETWLRRTRRGEADASDEVARVA